MASAQCGYMPPKESHGIRGSIAAYRLPSGKVEDKLPAHKGRSSGHVWEPEVQYMVNAADVLIPVRHVLLREGLDRNSPNSNPFSSVEQQAAGASYDECSGATSTLRTCQPRASQSDGLAGLSVAPTF